MAALHCLCKPLAVSGKARGDDMKVVMALRKLAHEDPCLHVDRDERRGANIKLISDHVGQAMGHGHELDKAQQAHGHAMQAGAVQHERRQCR